MKLPFETLLLVGSAAILGLLVVGSIFGVYEPTAILPKIVYNASRGVTEGWKIWIAASAGGLALTWHVLREKPRKIALIGLAVLAVLNYARWGPQSTMERVDAYDMVHYYLNAKYFDELGYLDLYPCAILADHENGGPFYDEGPIYMAQDPTTGAHELKPISHAVQRGRQIRTERFTPQRWTAFEHDLLYLQRDIRGYTRWQGNIPPAFNDRLWRQMVQDHGFNGTVPWTLVGRPIASVIPVESIKLIGHLDLLLFAVAIGMVGWAYGGIGALFTLIWLATTYSMRWPTLTWAFLRYDYVCMLIMATCLLKKNHHVLAGVAAGYSAVMRLFPAMWMWGPFAKGVSGLVRKKVHKRLLIFAAAFLLAVGFIQGSAMLRFGTEPVAAHFENMLDHNDPMQLSSRRIGLALGLTHAAASPTNLEAQPKLLTRARKEVMRDQKPIRYGLALLFLLVMGWGLRRVRDDEAFGFGFLPFFLITTASYYYYVARATMVVVHAGDLEKARNRVGLAALFSLEVFCNWAERSYPGHRMFLVGFLAWGLMLYAAVMCGWLLLESRTAEEAEA